MRTAGFTALEQGGPVRRLLVQVPDSGAIDIELLRDQIIWWSRGTIVEGAEVDVDVVESSAGVTEPRLVSVETGPWPATLRPS